MSGKLISANDVLKYTVLAGEIRNQYMEVVPAYFVREAPAVDAVEVVRCSNCKHFTEGMAIGMCKRIPDKPIIPVPYRHFCSYGERRDENAVD